MAERSSNEGIEDILRMVADGDVTREYFSVYGVDAMGKDYECEFGNLEEAEKFYDLKRGHSYFISLEKRWELNGGPWEILEVVKSYGK